MSAVEAQQVPSRDEVPVANTWDLTTVYASDAAWAEDAAWIEARLPQLAALQGTLGQSAATLAQCLRLRDEIEMRADQAIVYAMQRRDGDSSDPAGQALWSRASTLAAAVGAAFAFIEPEILAIPAEALAAWRSAEPDLQVYDYYLARLARLAPHVRSAEVEGILAQLSEVTRTPREAFTLLTNADLTFPTIEDEARRPIQLSTARYQRLMESQDRRVRHDAFDGLYSAYQGIRNTVATTLSGTVRAAVIDARIHDYTSSLEASLAPNEIPTAVYHQLIATITANLPRLHRYMDLRKRIMGLDELRVYDLMVSLVPEAELVVPYAEAQEMVLGAITPLGPACGDVARQAFASRWIDVYENKGKRSGAYSGGAYTTAPFILLNYQDRLGDAFTLAHELGHSLHSYFTHHTQPFIYGNYTLFVAEVASTLNEALLTLWLLETRTEPALRRRLIVEQLDDIRGTIFRQTMFAEFELWMHQASADGEPLTADVLSAHYKELLARYYGPSVVLEDAIALEWARIPHFYRPFYVYQYATGLSAALALAAQIAQEGQPAVERYLRFLSRGAAASPIDLLRDAGVDMTTPTPVQQAMDVFDRLLDQLEDAGDETSPR